jgi:hypothetical protein
LILFPGTPFTVTRVEAEERMIEIHFKKMCPNPRPVKTSKRNAQEIESKALVRSSLISTPFSL